MIFFYWCDILTFMRRKYIIFVLLTLVLSSFFGCRLAMSTDEPLEIVVKGNSFVLAWDPGRPDIPNDPNGAVRYKVYYRAHGSTDWRFLMEIESSTNPECRITEEDMNYGKYDLAVRAVNIQEQISELHSSLDSAANPFSGWYINWIGTK